MIIDVLLFILLFICVVLIYSLLITNVETRTFEFGILRMVGMKRNQVIALLLYQALAYAFLSYPFGLLLGQGVSYWVTSELATLLKVWVSPTLTSKAILTAGLLGIGMPIVASIFPIRRALGQNLHDSLDTRSSKTKAVQISIERSETQGFSWEYIMIGSLLGIFGSSIYYILPLALVSFNISLLLNIFVALLVGMLLGMTIFSMNVQSLIETALVYCLFFWEKASIRSIVLKNFVAHRVRNKKTSILFAVSLSFIVFINVSYNLQLNSFLYQQQQRNGCYLKVYTSSSQANPIYFQSSYSILENLDTPYIEAYSWISFPINQLVDMQQLAVTNVGHVFTNTMNFYAVSPNFFDVALSQYLHVADYQDSGSILENLYSVSGSSSAIVGSTYKMALGLDLNTDFLIHYQMVNPNINSSSDYLSRLRPLAFLNSAPAFTFSQFPQLLTQDALISFTTLIRLSNNRIHSMEDIPLKVFIIKMPSTITDAEIDSLKALIIRSKKKKSRLVFLN